MKHLLYRLFPLAILLVWVGKAEAQDAFSLEEAVQYAVQKNLNVKNSQLDAISAEARIGETKAIGLPQLSANFGYTNNLIIQRFFVPASTFNPSAPEGSPPVAMEFGIRNTGMASATLNQLLFNGSYFVGLKAAATYRELAQKNAVQSAVKVSEAVHKAYYSVQVAQQQAQILDLNISRLDTMLHETKALNQSGFVERIDVDRIEVQRNNLLAEKQKVTNLIDLSKALLKFQMGMPQESQIMLTDSLDPALNLEEFRALVKDGEQPVYSKRIEHSLLATQGKLAELDIKNVRSGYLPVATASLGYGYNAGQNTFGSLITKKWFNNAAFNFNLQIPIFDGRSKHFQLQQKKVALEQIQNNSRLLEQSIDLEAKQASVNISNALETLGTHQRNIDLAKEVVRVSKIKYQEGVGSNIEVINAESSLKEAQTNFFAALYDLLISKVDLQKALGELYHETK
ncbi:TolC family protein [Ravibacter arvi]|uniref:TolC family protein n=1 Tax=Ravibacter arvi TaxID=2051041 RepID=A0ABP8LTY4_9BACT